MIKAVLFDFDGTIFDDEKNTIKSKIIEGKKLGYQVKRQDVIDSLGLSKENSKKLFQERYGEDFPYEYLAKVRVDYILEDIKKHGFRLKPYVKKILKFLKKENLKIILCTSTTKEKINAYAPYTDIFEKFDAIITGEDVIHGKPSPDIFLLGCEKAQVEISEALVIEDTNCGVLGALNGSLDVIMIPDLVTPDKTTLSHKVKIYRNMDEVITYIKNVNKI
jgi:HAD superfamily hydrolase (TIGR01509 family)